MKLVFHYTVRSSCSSCVRVVISLVTWPRYIDPFIFSFSVSMRLAFSWSSLFIFILQLPTAGSFDCSSAGHHLSVWCWSHMSLSVLLRYCWFYIIIKRCLPILLFRSQPCASFIASHCQFRAKQDRFPQWDERESLHNLWALGMLISFLIRCSFHASCFSRCMEQDWPHVMQ